MPASGGGFQGAADDRADGRVRRLASSGFIASLQGAAGLPRAAGEPSGRSLGWNQATDAGHAAHRQERRSLALTGRRSPAFLWRAGRGIPSRQR